MSEQKGSKIAVVWRGDATARRNATPQNNRYVRVFEELAALGIEAEPAVFDESVVPEAPHPEQHTVRSGYAFTRPDARECIAQ